MAKNAGTPKRRRAEVRTDVPSVLVGMGSLVGIVLVSLLILPLAFLFGYGKQGVLVAILAGILGAFAGIGYFLYKPINPFSDNAYAPKSFTKLTPDELRALNYLNSSQGRSIAILVALGVALIPALGALSWRLDLVITPHIAQVKPFNTALWITTLTLCGPVTIVSYFLIICRVLWKRWDWICENQPLPTRRVLLKYAKGQAVGSFDHLYGTEYSEEMENVLRGIPGRQFAGWVLQIVGVSLIVISGRHIFVSGFQRSTILVLALGAIAIMAGRRIR